MQCTCEMRIHTYLRSQSASKYGSIEGTIPYGIEAVSDDRIDMCGPGEETVNTQHACRRLMVLIAYERRLLQLHGDSFDILARVQRSGRRGVRAKGLSFDRHYEQYGIELREHMLYQFSEPVHHA